MTTNNRVVGESILSVTIKTNDGRTSTYPAVRLERGLAIHQSRELNTGELMNDWSITHTQSGFSVLHGRNKDIVNLAMDELLKVGDWTRQACDIAKDWKLKATVETLRFQLAKEYEESA